MWFISHVTEQYGDSDWNVKRCPTDVRHSSRMSFWHGMPQNWLISIKQVNLKTTYIPSIFHMKQFGFQYKQNSAFRPHGDHINITWCERSVFARSIMSCDCTENYVLVPFACNFVKKMVRFALNIFKISRPFELGCWQ